ncbi:MAG: EscU/YscU/HrcU family type III secretion system export apparatus switch protein [Thermoanaerobacterales bacterium]|nr:EscU/YscU/HrcU family type III secretion system export apparatus switch protein [Bacillota bacterium]MDI6906704.1 EscU/YscU/HrcU family type III secretion system export apparatus switch protein [Thermoanaerobacterales bacterium]
MTIRSTGSGDKQSGSGRPRAAAALRYDPGSDNAPRVVAAGRGRLAEEIEARAREAGVPVYRDAGLAWTLTGLGIDREVPPALYEAVAAVIAWVYALEEKNGERADARGD